MNDAAATVQRAASAVRFGALLRAMRWLLLVPAAVVAWYALFAVALYARSFLEYHLCPPRHLVSGFCVDASVQQGLAAFEHVAVALSAIAAGAAATATAPSHKGVVAWGVFATGLVVAGVLAYITRSASFFAAATLGGMLGVFILQRVVRAAARRDRAVDAAMRVTGRAPSSMPTP